MDKEVRVLREQIGIPNWYIPWNNHLRTIRLWTERTERKRKIRSPGVKGKVDSSGCGRPVRDQMF